MKHNVWVIGSMVAASVLLSACASNQVQSNSQIKTGMALNKADYVPLAEANKSKTKVVKEYVPVAIPGQLMPAPTVQHAKGKGSKPFLTQEAAVNYANKKAQVVPKSQDFFNAMMTYDFMPGAMYTVYTAPMKITDLMFQPGEKIISEAAGDTLRWQIAQTYSGEGASKVQHILVKPNQANLTNTMIVTTNRRVYHIELQSTGNDTYMVSVKWHYPASNNMIDYMASNAMGDDAGGGSNQGVSTQYKLDLASMHFNYEYGVVKGKTPNWMPVKIFNDGRQTFIEFPKDFYNKTLPVLFVADNNDKYTTMLNWRLKGRYMIVDAVLNQARLQTGVKTTGETIVQIKQKPSDNA